MCVIFSGGGSALKSDSSEDLVLADRDVIVTTLNIKAMEFRDHDEGDLTQQVYPYECGLNVPIISSLGTNARVFFSNLA